MRILGIDYGLKKLGLALAEGRLAEPWKVIRVDSPSDGVEKVAKEIESGNFNKVVVGISEGKMAEETEKFSLSLGLRLKIPVENFDETLTTQEAQGLAIAAGMKRKKRQQLEDAFAAAVMLQLYLDRHV